MVCSRDACQDDGRSISVSSCSNYVASIERHIGTSCEIGKLIRQVVLRSQCAYGGRCVLCSEYKVIGDKNR